MRRRSHCRTITRLPDNIGHWFIAGITLTVGFATLSASAFDGPRLDERYPDLDSCSQNEFQVFLTDSDKEDIETDLDVDTIDVWTSRFHRDVEQVINELVQLNSISCTTTLNGEQAAPFSVKQIAGKLTPWEDPGAVDLLTRSDTTAVLMEYLRVYECALTARNTFSQSEVFNEIIYKTATANSLSFSLIYTSPAIVLQESLEQQRKIRRELNNARPTLEKALTVAQGLTRFAALDTSVICLQRASLDLRNAAALAAEAAAQLPRALNVKDPLRDYDYRE